MSRKTNQEKLDVIITAERTVSTNESAAKL